MTRIKKRIVDSGGTTQEIITALTSNFTMPDGTKVSSKANYIRRDDAMSVIGLHLQSPSPVIALLNDTVTGGRHAVLITAIAIDLNSRPFFYEVYDPAIHWVSDVPNAKRRAYKYGYFSDMIEDKIDGFVFPLIVSSKTREEQKRIHSSQQNALKSRSAKTLEELLDSLANVEPRARKYKNYRAFFEDYSKRALTARMPIAPFSFPDGKGLEEYFRN